MELTISGQVYHSLCSVGLRSSNFVSTDEPTLLFFLQIFLLLELLLLQVLHQDLVLLGQACNSCRRGSQQATCNLLGCRVARILLVLASHLELLALVGVHVDAL